MTKAIKGVLLPEAEAQFGSIVAEGLYDISLGLGAKDEDSGTK